MAKSNSLSKFSGQRRQKLVFIVTVVGLLYLLFGAVRILPIAQTLLLSLRKTNLLGTRDEFVWLQNYVELLQDRNFLVSLKNTVFIAVITVPVSLIVSLSLALAYHTKIRFHGFFELIFFTPVIMPTVAVSLVWRWMYDPEFGLLNIILGKVGLEPVSWLTDPNIAIFSVMILWVWKWVGYYAILFLVGLQNIPSQYNEAARVDGASALQTFYRITLPLLKPITLFVSVIATIWSLRIFVPVYVLTVGSQGAPGKAVSVLVYDMYQNFFTFFKVGYATAEGFLLFLLVAIFTFVQWKSSGQSS